MKHILSVVLIALVVGACADPNGPTKTVRIKMQQPVYMSFADLRSAVRVDAPHEVVKPGKIYVYGHYLLISEIGDGVHIVDNSNPSNPRYVAFVVVPGTGDMAVKDNIMYVDSYVDLVAIDITNPEQARVVHRIEAIFPQALNATEFYYSDPDSGVVTGWREVEVDVEVDNGRYQWGDVSLDRPVSSDRAEGPGAPSSGGNSGGQTGTGGSMARFTVVRSWLYAVTHSDLQLFNLATPSRPLVWSRINLGWGIETIFPYKDKLFIGSMTGMFIFDNSDPSSPSMLSTFSHARACDPVVATDSLAFVTLRSGTMCGGGQNQLDVIDITNLMNPRLIKTYFMQEPQGVGIDGSTLFVCDGMAGLKIYNASRPASLQLLAHIPDWNAYDIIPLGGTAILSTREGVMQIDYSNPQAPRVLSTLYTRKK
jgi:hypothetical protein